MQYDLVIAGAGSAGFGAALAAGRRGLRVLLVDSNALLGGSSTAGGINTWEPVASGPGYPAELYARLVRRPVTIGVSRTIHHWTAAEPWGWSRVDRALTYRHSLRRSRIHGDNLNRVTFEPDAMAAEMALMLAETGSVDVRLGWSCVAAITDSGAVTALVLRGPGGEERVTAPLFIDATAQLALAQAAGCRTYLGCEPRTRYGEEHAPDHHQDRINGVSLCFRLTPATTPAVEALPPGIPAEPYPVSAFSITEYPCGDLNMNPLPLMQGWEHHSLPAERRRPELLARVYRSLFWAQSEKGFDRYRLAQVFPMTGVREGPRLIGRHVLTETDVRRGCSGQAHPERWITLADHALDIHGDGHFCGELREPFGVPYECLLPCELRNLAVACRGSSFSHLAAASCRLTRTMMQLGHAAGIAAALATGRHVGFPDVDLAALQRELAADHVSLDPTDARFRQPDTEPGIAD